MLYKKLLGILLFLMLCLGGVYGVEYITETFNNPVINISGTDYDIYGTSGEIYNANQYCREQGYEEYDSLTKSSTLPTQDYATYPSPNPGSSWSIITVDNRVKLTQIICRTEYKFDGISLDSDINFNNSYLDTNNITFEVNTSLNSSNIFYSLLQSPLTSYNDGTMVGFDRNDGTVSGGVTIEDNAIFCDGSGKVDLSNPYSLPLNEYSISFWTKPISGGVIIDNIASGPNRLYISYSTSTKVIRVYAGTTVWDYLLSSSEQSIFENGNLHLITISLSTNGTHTTINRYLDNILLESRTLDRNSTITIAPSFRLCTDPSITYYTGFIDNILFFDYILSESEVTEIYNAGRNSYSPISDGLIAQYSDKDFAGTADSPTTIYDTNMISRGQTASYNNITSQAINFDGVNDYVEIGDIDLNVNTICSWIKLNSLASDSGINQDIIEKFGSYTLRQVNYDNSFHISYEGLSDTFYSPNDIVATTNIWQFICFSYNSTHITGFLNGDKKSSELSSGTLTQNNNNLFLGSRSGTSLFFNGSISNTLIFNRSLTQEEITALYTGSEPVLDGLVWSQGYVDIANNKVKDRLYRICTNCQSTNLDIYNLSEDNYNILFTANNGDTNITTDYYYFTVDLTNPIITFDNGEEYNYIDTFNIQDIINPVCSDTNLANCTITWMDGNTSFTTNGTFSGNKSIPDLVGNYTFSITAYDLSGNSNTETGYLYLNPYRIKFSFFSDFSGSALTNVYLSEETEGSLGNSGSNNFITAYVNPGTYNFTFNKTGYVTKSEVVIKDNITIEQLETVNLSIVLNFTLRDERTLEIFNLTPVTLATMQIICLDGSVTQSNINSTNFEITIPCPIRNIKFILDYTSDSYFRSILVDETELNRDVYLIDLTTTQSIFNTFTLFDLTDIYVNPRLSFKKYVDDEAVEITGDVIDVEGKVPGYFILNDQYTLELSSDNIPTKSLGFYSADTLGDKVIKLFSLNFAIADDNIVGKVKMFSYIQNGTIIGMFNDTSNSTIKTEFFVYNGTQYGNLLYQAEITSDNIGSFSYNIPSSLENTSMFVKLINTNNLGEFTDQRTLRQNNNITLGMINFNLSMDWIITVFLGFIALTFTALTASTGALIILALSALFVTFGWFSLSWVLIALAMVVTILKIAKEGERK